MTLSGRRDSRIGRLDDEGSPFRGISQCTYTRLLNWDGVMFKFTNDPRITRFDRLLRKYSLDELPQFFNVLCGEMSVVSSRPPLADEVKEYDPSHLRRLDVTPGVTGLWQLQAHQDPSFANYVLLDMKYIDNWSIWLDFRIVQRTIGMVFAGTGFQSQPFSSCAPNGVQKR